MGPGRTRSGTAQTCPRATGSKWITVSWIVGREELQKQGQPRGPTP